MYIQTHPACQMLKGNGEQNPRNLRLTESADRLTLMIDGIFVDDGVLRTKRARMRDVPFRILISQPLDEWEWNFINGRIFEALKRPVSVIEMDLTFPVFEPVR
jgi:hypothetical protein